jgi:hypothetical protein
MNSVMAMVTLGKAGVVAGGYAKWALGPRGVVPEESIGDVDFFPLGTDCAAGENFQRILSYLEEAGATEKRTSPHAVTFTAPWGGPREIQVIRPGRFPGDTGDKIASQFCLTVTQAFMDTVGSGWVGESFDRDESLIQARLCVQKDLSDKHIAQLLKYAAKGYNADPKEWLAFKASYDSGNYRGGDPGGDFDAHQFWRDLDNGEGDLDEAAYPDNSK